MRISSSAREIAIYTGSLKAEKFMKIRDLLTPIYYKVCARGDIAEDQSMIYLEHTYTLKYN